ncbi:MAG: hypothetical protein JW787_01440 [Sedimentisphaerales bacterium]|nr:hypothetical protein [Sedimentisphaerales bacterium]
MANIKTEEAKIPEILFVCPVDITASPAGTRATASILTAGKDEVIIYIARHDAAKMIKRLVFFCHGQGRGAKTAIAKKIIVSTRLKGCESNPTEPDAIHAAIKDDMTSTVKPEQVIVSGEESLTNPSDCNSLLWLT